MANLINLGVVVILGYSNLGIVGNLIFVLKWAGSLHGSFPGLYLKCCDVLKLERDLLCGI